MKNFILNFLEAFIKELHESRTLWCFIISTYISLLFGVLLKIEFALFPALMMGLIVIAFTKRNGKHNWPGLIATILGGLLIQLIVIL